MVKIKAMSSILLSLISSKVAHLDLFSRKSSDSLPTFSWIKWNNPKKVANVNTFEQLCGVQLYLRSKCSCYPDVNVEKTDVVFKFTAENELLETKFLMFYATHVFCYES